MRHAITTFSLGAVLVGAAACNPEQREQIDSAAGVAETTALAVISIIDVDMGRRLGPDKKITDATETFAPSDTIYASVHTSGVAKEGEIAARWTFPDGSDVSQRADSVAPDADGYLAFFITKPEGLAKGKYTFRVLVNDREVRSKDVTVR